MSSTLWKTSKVPPPALFDNGRKSLNYDELIGNELDVALVVYDSCDKYRAGCCGYLLLPPDIAGTRCSQRVRKKHANHGAAIRPYCVLPVGIRFPISVPIRLV